MRKAYIKPMMFPERGASGVVPVVAAVASALGVSQAVAGLGLGAVAGLGAAKAATAVAQKVGDYSQLDRLPALEMVEA